MARRCPNWSHMRALLGAMTAALMGAAIAWCGNLEVSTGFLPGPRSDAHSPEAGATAWGYRSLWSRLGNEAARRAYRSSPRFSRPLVARRAMQYSVELVVFHPAMDQDSDSPDARPTSVCDLTGWSAPGLDFGQFVPRNLERIAGVIRERLAENLSLVPEADVSVAAGEAQSLDPRRIDRPVVAREKIAQGCAVTLERFAGCLVEEPATSDLYRQLAPLVLKPAPKSSEP